MFELDVVGDPRRHGVGRAPDGVAGDRREDAETPDLVTYERQQTPADHRPGAETHRSDGQLTERERLEAKCESLTHAARVTFFGFLDEYEDVLGHMRAADVFPSPSTREGFGITYAEAMAADCLVIGADHPESAADEVIGDAGYLTQPTVDGVAEALNTALSGERPPTDPSVRAQRFDWDEVASQAETAYRRAIRDEW